MNMRFTPHLWITLLITLLGVWVTPLPAADLASVLEDVKNSAGQTESLVSDFRQEKHLDIMDENLLSQGRFAYQKPDQLRWELLAPVASGFVLRGQEGERWNSLSGSREHYRIDSDPVMAMIARQLLAWARVDLDWLRQRYVMTLLSEEPLRLQLTPRDAGEASFIKHLEISFGSDRRYVHEVLLQEQSADYTRITFSRVNINKPLPGDIFMAPDL